MLAFEYKEVATAEGQLQTVALRKTFAKELFGMPKISERRRARNPKPLPLFQWAAFQPANRQIPTLAERRLLRSGFSPSTAALYASLAGLPVEGDQ